MNISSTLSLFGKYTVAIICCLFVAFPSITTAQISKPDTLIVKRIYHNNIRLDGVLDEAEWAQAMTITNFTQRELAENEPATETTAITVLCNDEYLYIGARCYDKEPQKIIANQLRRDFPYWTDDNLNIIIDTYNDKRNAYLFVINPNGARADILITGNGAGYNRDWNGVWDCAGVINDSGWFAEMKIPLNTLRFSPDSLQTWGINFERNIRRKREQVQWQGWARDSRIEQISRGGILSGITDVESVNLIEVKPYLLGGGARNRNEQFSSVSDIGFDVNYLVTPTLKLNVTVNTDFAQVEADRLQVNLTRFPLFFPELREFFLEGRDFFDFGLGSVTGFYSRRIGLPSNSFFAASVPIIGGVRLMGKEGDNNIAFLSMQTAATETEPSTNFAAASWRKDIFEQSFLSINATSKIEAGRQNFLYGGEFRYETADFLGDKNLRLGVAAAQTYTSDRATATDETMRIYAEYPNNYVRINAEYQMVGEEFNPEVGFVPRTNFHRLRNRIEFRPRPEWADFAQYFSIKPVDIDYYINKSTGKLETLSLDFRPFAVLLKSGEWVEFSVNRTTDVPLEDFNLSPQVTVQAGEYTYYRGRAIVETFTGRRLSGFSELTFGDYYHGEGISFYQSVTWRANKYISLSATYERNNFTFAEGELETDIIGTRLEFATSPWLFGSLFAQWNRQTGFMFLNFRVNWIPILGGDIFFVANQAINTEGSVKLENTTILAKGIWRILL